MKTRDRILTASLALFNDEGVGKLSALDIATALEMSPGHLYYHFRGKREIVLALFEAHEAEIAEVAGAALAELGAAVEGRKAARVHLRILLEEIHDVRFLYREAASLTLAWPDLRPRFRRLFAAMRGLVGMMLDLVAPGDSARPDQERRELLTDQIVLMLTSVSAQLHLAGETDPPRALLSRAADRIESLISALA